MLLRSSLATLKSRPYLFTQQYRTFISSSPLFLTTKKPKRISSSSGAPAAPLSKPPKSNLLPPSPHKQRRSDPLPPPPQKQRARDPLPPAPMKKHGNPLPPPPVKQQKRSVSPPSSKRREEEEKVPFTPPPKQRKNILPPPIRRQNENVSSPPPRNQKKRTSSLAPKEPATTTVSTPAVNPQEEGKKPSTIAFNLQQYFADVVDVAGHINRFVAGMRLRLRQGGKDLNNENEDKKHISELLDRMGNFMNEKLLLRIQLRIERATQLTAFNEVGMILLQVNAMRIHDFIVPQILNSHILASDYDLLSFSYHLSQIESYVKSLEEKIKQTSKNDATAMRELITELKKVKPEMEMLKQSKLECMNAVIGYQKDLIKMADELIEQKDTLVADIKQEISRSTGGEGTSSQKNALVSFNEYKPSAQFDIDIVETRAMLANNLLVTGEYADSVSQFNFVIDAPVDETNIRQVFRRAMSYINRGTALMALKRLGEASDSFNKGLSLAQESKFQTLIDQVQRVLPKLTDLIQRHKDAIAGSAAQSSSSPPPPPPLANSQEGSRKTVPIAEKGRPSKRGNGISSKRK